MSAPDPVPADDEGTVGPGGGPTPEQVEERRRRANRATRGVLAANLVLEALIVLLVPRTLAHTTTGLDTTKTTLLVVLTVLLVLTGGLLRRRFGIGLGSLLQVAVVATGVWVHAMFVLGLIFLAIWLYTLNLRHELVGTPGGWRLLVS